MRRKNAAGRTGRPGKPVARISTAGLGCTDGQAPESWCRNRALGSAGGGIAAGARGRGRVGAAMSNLENLKKCDPRARTPAAGGGILILTGRKKPSNTKGMPAIFSHIPQARPRISLNPRPIIPHHRANDIKRALLKGRILDSLLYSNHEHKSSRDSPAAPFGRRQIAGPARHA